LIASGMLTGAGAAPADDSGLPPLPIFHAPGATKNLYNDSGTIFDPITQNAVKPKVRITLPPLLQRVYNFQCISSLPQNCAPEIHPDYPPTQFPGSTAKVIWIYLTGQIWVKSPDGTNPQFGTFPPVKVQALAFGSIPVTATIRIRQTETAGLVDPLTLKWLSSGSAIPVGANVSWNGITYPGPTITGQSLVAEPVITGALDVQLSDLKVDQLPVDVGPDCHTVTPAQVTLSAPGGYVALGSWKPGTPGQPGYSPFKVPSYLSDNDLEIPAFSGCHNGADDLDTLLTGMISGPHNTITATQIRSLSGFWCDTPGANCPPPPKAVH